MPKSPMQLWRDARDQIQELPVADGRWYAYCDGHQDALVVEDSDCVLRRFRASLETHRRCAIQGVR